MNRAGLLAAGLGAATAAALALRLPQLDRRPVHADEAVHMWKCAELRWGPGYRYDPHDYHGPTLNYLTLPVLAAAGAPSFADTQPRHYRLVPALAGAALVPLLTLLVPALGGGAAVLAGLCAAVSPALVFYSRYYIQETLLVGFTLLTLGAGWRFFRSRRIGWALLAGVGLGLMHATKETCVLVLAALALAGVVTERPWRRAAVRAATVSQPALWPGLVVGSAAAVLTSVTLFSALLTDAGGPWRSLAALATYADRAAGTTHSGPWYQYLTLLVYQHPRPGPVWTEAVILGGATLGAVAAFRPRWFGGAERVTGDVRFVRFLAVYAAALLALYSAIPYKTPWCVLGPLHALTLLAGCGMATLIRVAPRTWGRPVVALLLAGGVGHLASQAWRAAVPLSADDRNPYVYAGTRRSVADLLATLDRLAAAHRDGRRVRIDVIADNVWPLPWYLRRFERVGYWEPAAAPATPAAPLVLVGLSAAAVADRLPGARVAAHFGLRRDEVVMLCVDRSLWEAAFAVPDAAVPGAAATDPTAPAATAAGEGAP